MNHCKQEARAHTTFPDLLGTDQPEDWNWGESLGIVYVVVSCHAVTTRIDQVLLDELTGARSLVQLANEEQATVEVTREPWKSIFNEALTVS